MDDRDVRITNLELHSIPLHNDPLVDDRDVRITNLELHSIPLHNDPLVDGHDRDVRIEILELPIWNFTAYPYIMTL